VTNPCTDRRYAALAAGLNEDASDQGLKVSVRVSPILRLRDTDLGSGADTGAQRATDRILGDLVPVATLSAPETPAGGLYRCAVTPENTTIRPYLVEPWRASAEIPALYGAALSEDLAQSLDTLITAESPFQ
jgi:hypothetical protein